MFKHWGGGGGLLGEVLEVETHDEGECGPYVRVRVSIEITKPL